MRKYGLSFCIYKVQGANQLYRLVCAFIMPPTLKKLMGHIAFGACVGACVGGCVGQTFCTYCNF